MHALKRDVASTAKSESTTNRSTSSASDVIDVGSSEEEDQAKQGERGPARDVQRDLGQSQTGRRRFDDADGDPYSGEPGDEREQPNTAARPRRGDEHVQNDRREQRQLERARVDD